MKKPTLDEFIAAYGTGRYSSNLYVREDGFRSLYVRIGKRWFVDMECDPTLDLASMTVRYPGKRTFTRLVERLRHDYPKMTLYVESVLSPRFRSRLKLMGFAPVGGPGFDCFVMLPSPEARARQDPAWSALQ